MLVVLLCALLYGTGYLVWFWETPLGKVPVLDGRENMILARQIAGGELPAEPFFRAMLYPALLAPFAGFGLTDRELLVAASAVGLLFHLIGTLAVFRTAQLLWQNAAPAILSGLVFGLYPVAVYFAAEPLDTAPSLSLLTVATWLAAEALNQSGGPPKRRGDICAAFCGTTAALAFIARPNFLPVLLALPVVLFAFTRGPWRGSVAAGLAIAGMLPVIAGYGLWQRSVSGHFGVMPWQGGYSLWVANGPEANGRYYTQKSVISYEGPHQNPARLESESRYRGETGAPSEAATPFQIDRYWREKTKAAILQQPGQWLRLEAKKLYYFFNDFEQYNNKTYAFHRAESPWLRWNPLSWGVLFGLAVAGAFAARRENRRVGGALLLLSGAYLAGALLVFAGDRFRFPLTPFAAVLAGGLVPFLTNFRRWAMGRRLSCLGATAAAFAIAFSQFAGARDTSTFTQDRMLLANASLRSGDDSQAEAFARQVLEGHPSRQDARQVLAAARFNQHLAGTKLIEAENAWAEMASDLAAAVPASPSTRWTGGVAEWNAGRRDRALEIWRSLASTERSRVAVDALAVIVLSGHASSEEKQRLLGTEWRKQSPYAWAARAELEGERFESQLWGELSASDWKAIKQRAARLLSKR